MTKIEIRMLSDDQIRTRGWTGSDSWCVVSVNDKEVARMDDYGSASVLNDANVNLQWLGQSVTDLWGAVALEI